MGEEEVKTKVLTALLCFTVKSSAEMDLAREVKGVKRRNNMCAGRWEDLIEKESYLQEKGGKMVGGLGLGEEHSYCITREKAQAWEEEEEVKGLGKWDA